MVITLELYRFSLFTRYIWYIAKNIDLSVRSLLIIKMLHRYNHGKVTAKVGS